MTIAELAVTTGVWVLASGMAACAQDGTGSVGVAEAGFAAPAGYPDPTRFEGDIRAFEAADAHAMPAPDGVVGVGSSSMRMWHPWLGEDLAPVEVIPRGFGGSTMVDVLHYLDPLVLKYRPRAVVLYEGDNDIAAGVAPDGVLAVFDEFLARLHAELPAARVYVLSVKPSPQRWSLWPKMKETNAGLAERCARDERLTYVDVAAPLLGEDGLPRRDLFAEDELHLNRKGYLAWRDVLRPVLLQTEIAGIR